MDEKEESAAMNEDGPKEKSTLKAYLWFLVGGFVGAHHMYLGNDYQAVLMISTVGGCYGLGLLLDLFYLPRYVEQANRHPYYGDLGEVERKHFKKPRANWTMITLQMVVGAFFRSLVHLAIPFHEYPALRFLSLPAATAAGVWLVAKVFHMRCSYVTTLLGSYTSHVLLSHLISFPTFFFPLDTTLGAVLGSSRSLDYNTATSPGRVLRGKKKLFLTSLMLMATLQGSYYYNNATVQIQGTSVPLKDAVFEFFDSTAWVEAKVALAQFYEEVWVVGVRAALNRLVMWGGDGGLSEEAAYALLGVQENITSTALKKQFRAMSLTHHPDKQPPERKEEANKKFMELKGAYEVIMKMRSFRTKMESAKLLREIADRFNKFEQKHKEREEKKKEEL